jgi:predicted transcriptional regulator
MTKEQIGQAIADARKAQGISIRKMAELAKTSTRAIQAVEKGWYNVGIDTYTAIADALRMRIEIKG